jgi:hypothetical protein
MKRWICVLLVLPHAIYSQSWTNQLSIPAHVSAYQKNQSPIIGLRDLPALLGFERKKGIGVLIENKYGISSLSLLSMSISHPLAAGNISLNSSIQGGSLFSHLSGRVNYGVPLNKISTIGISIGIVHFKLKEDAADLVVQTIAGLAHLINEKTLLAIHYQYNRNLATTNLKKISIPDGLGVGIGHQVSRPVFIQLDIRKQEQIQVFPAINWRPHEKIECWFGLNGTGQFAAGIYGHARAMSTGIALTNHPHLGYSIQLQLNKHFHEKK